MKSKDTVKADSPDAVSILIDNIQNRSGITEAGSVSEIKTQTYATTTPTNDFNAHGNINRIELDHGDGHIQNTKNTYAFDNADSSYHGRLSLFLVRSTVPGNAAQDKTTVRKSEFTNDFDGLSLLQTAQPDNALAVTTTDSAHVEAPSSRLIHQRTSGKMPLLHIFKPFFSCYSTRGWLLSRNGLNRRTTPFTCNALGRGSSDRPDGTWVTTEDVCDDSRSVTNPRSESSATAKYRMTIKGSAASPSTTWYDRVGRAIRARTVGFNGQFVYQNDARYNGFGQVGCMAENDYAATGPTHLTKTNFNTPGRVDVVTSQDDTQAKAIYNGLRPTNEFGVADQMLKRVYDTPSAGGVNLVEAMTFDRLSRLTSVSVAESGAVTVNHENLANTNYRTPTSDFGNVGTYGSGIQLSQKNNPKSWCKPAYKTLKKEEFKVLKRLVNLIFRWFVHCMICAEKTKNEVPVPKIDNSKQSSAGMIGYHYDI